MFGFGGSSNTAAPTEGATSGMPALSELGGSNKIKQLKAETRQQLSLAHAQELVQTMTKHCFDSCVQVPSDSLSASQQKCVSQCMGLYTQAWSVIQKSYIDRVQQEQANGNL